MALNFVIRRASSTVVPLAVRAVGSSRAIHSAISSVGKSTLSRELSHRSFQPFLRFSSAVADKASSDEKLLQVIESEIECAAEDQNEHSVDMPNEFPFEIQDNPGERTILLTRKYQDEIIRVEVDMPTIEEEEDKEDDEEEGDGQSTLPMVVSVSKGNGECLEFGITAFPDKVCIDSLSIKHPERSEDQLAYEGPDFNDLDENLQKAFGKYLEIRGIKASTTNLLMDYMADKDNREYTQWLKSLKGFIEK